MDRRVDEQGVTDAVTRACREFWPRRSALRRFSDQVEVAARWAAVLAVLVMLPVVLAVGSAVAAGSEERHAVDRSTRHQVNAVVIGEERVVPGRDDGWARSVPVTRAIVRWTAPDGSEHTGVAWVSASTPVGEPLALWADGSDHVVPRPAAPGAGGVDGVSIAVLLMVVVLSGAVGGFVLVRALLDRARRRAWEQEWAAIGLGHGSAR
jgi:hypothetical protein